MITEQFVGLDQKLYVLYTVTLEVDWLDIFCSSPCWCETAHPKYLGKEVGSFIIISQLTLVQYYCDHRHQPHRQTRFLVALGLVGCERGNQQTPFCFGQAAWSPSPCEPLNSTQGLKCGTCVLFHLIFELLLLIVYCWFELMKNTIPTKIPVLFSRPQKIPASFIDPKKSLLAKMSDPKKILQTPPSLKYVSGAPGTVHNWI